VVSDNEQREARGKAGEHTSTQRGSRQQRARVTTVSGLSPTRGRMTGRIRPIGDVLPRRIAGCREGRSQAPGSALQRCGHVSTTARWRDRWVRVSRTLRADGPRRDVRMLTARVEVWVATASPRLASDWVATASGRFPDDLTSVERNRRIVQIAVRRTVLAAHLRVSPEEIELHGGTDAPLSLAGSEGPALSASHHDDVTVLALADAPAVGIDIEPMLEPEWDAALDEILTGRELVALESLPEGDRPASYFTIWTMKEAVMKALGEGLGDRDPKTLEVASPPARPALLAVDAAAPAEPWAVETVRLERHVLSVAVRGAAGIDLRVYRWPIDLGGYQR
jgi:4'-phosphopantetheinyl transferase